MNSIKPIRLYNTLTKKIETIEEIEKNKIKMYVCGPTVYDFIHIGNARSIVVYDLLYRILCYKYGEKNVIYVRNITDVDDKIVNRAKLENRKAEEVSKENIEKFLCDAEYLLCKNPNYQPKVTESITEIIDMIKTLVDKGFAYEIDSGIYFETAKYEDYYLLSGRNFDEMLSSVRNENDLQKKSPSDFALWKKRKNDETDCLFESPWGSGRPGWHIECSAMSKKYLGNDFDIHGGGIDIIFPHHTNERAQSICANNSDDKSSIYAKYWIHNGLLTVNGEKMSKSIGNFITVKDLRDKKIHEEILRYFLLSVNYRSPLDFNEKAINDSTENLNYLYRTISVFNNVDLVGDCASVDDCKEFIFYLYDDMNTPSAIAYILNLAKEINLEKDLKIKLNLANKLKKCCNLLGLLNENPEFWCGKGANSLHLAVLNQDINEINKILEKAKININAFDKKDLSPLHYAYIIRDESIIKLLIERGANSKLGNPDFALFIRDKINARNDAKKRKDFEAADRLRSELLLEGVILEDLKSGKVDWKYKT